MALYSYSEPQIERMIDRAHRWRTGYVGVATFAVVVSFLLLIYRPNLPIFRRSARDWFFGVLCAAVLHPLLSLIWKRKRWQDRLRNTLTHFGIELTSDAVSLHTESGIVRQVQLKDAIRIEEPRVGRGLYLRTSNRYRWFLIPRNLEGYGALKNQLIISGLPLTPSLFLPNWEEFVFVALFVSTLLCSGFSERKTVLTANLLVSALLAVLGLAMVNANSDNPKIRNARIGCFIPLAAAVLGLLLR